MAMKIGIDTSIFIYLFEENKEYFTKAEKLFRQIQGGKIEAVFSAIGMIEILVGAKKSRDRELELQYKDLIAGFPNLTIMGINENIVDLASDLRTKYNIKTPNAIHIATAIDFNAVIFFTNDASLRKIKEIKILTLNDL